MGCCLTTQRTEKEWWCWLSAPQGRLVWELLKKRLDQGISSCNIQTWRQGQEPHKQLNRKAMTWKARMKSNMWKKQVIYITVVAPHFSSLLGTIAIYMGGTVRKAPQAIQDIVQNKQVFCPVQKKRRQGCFEKAINIKHLHKRSHVAEDNCHSWTWTRDASQLQNNERREQQHRTTKTTKEL